MPRVRRSCVRPTTTSVIQRSLYYTPEDLHNIMSTRELCLKIRLQHPIAMYITYTDAHQIRRLRQIPKPISRKPLQLIQPYRIRRPLARRAQKHPRHDGITVARPRVECLLPWCRTKASSASAPEPWPAEKARNSPVASSGEMLARQIRGEEAHTSATLVAHVRGTSP